MIETSVFPHTIALLVGLLGLATLVAILVRPLRIPYTVGLVVAGLVLGGLASSAGIPAIEVTPDLVLVVLLPGLVFEAGYRLRVDELRRWSTGLLLLAVPGVLISALVVALVLHVFAGLPIELAFVVGAMVSATDPAAVVAVFKRLRVSPSLATIVDGESLLNDGTGLVLFAIALQAVTQPFAPGDAILAFAGAILVSVTIGLVTGYVAARLISVIDDHLIELTISVVLAYGSYLLADEFHLSGVLATVTAAVVLGNVGPGRMLTATGADAIDTVWEFFAFLLTAVTFLLVGLAIPPARLLDALGPITWAVIAALVGRALIVYLLLGGTARLAPIPGLSARLPIGWLHVLFWSGLRGAVAVAMALALPADLPQRGLLQEITFGVVLFTLLVQGTTVGRLVSRVGAVVAPGSSAVVPTAAQMAEAPPAS
jgi:monovalent cation:H+ antiporter, CPA1 family